jgi:hypothetical protein
MRSFGTEIDDDLASLSGVSVRNLVWIEAKNRISGAAEVLGLWNGEDVRAFTVDGVSRNYSGAGSLLSVSEISGGVGLDVRMHVVTLSKIPPQVALLIHGYDSRLAPIEVHQVHFDTVKGVVIGDPIRILKGWVEELPVPTPSEGGSENISLTIASASRALTKTLTVKKSDEAQRQISSTDRGREYASVSGSVGVFWGVKNSSGVAS